MKNKTNFNLKATVFYLSLFAVSFFSSCVNQFEYELPEANSKEDTVFPEANFSYAPSLDDFKTVKFTNLSTESINFVWDFGNGASSTEQDPTFTFDTGEGTYPVTLTASDANGVEGNITIEVLVVEGPYQPIILEPGFEDNTLPDGSGDGRDSWRNSDLGGVIQITGSPVTFGSQGAKLPTPAGDRIGYQEIIVEPDTNYDLNFWYTMLSGSSDPSLTVSILGVTENGGTFKTLQEVEDRTIASVTVTNDDEPDVYVQQKLSFNSGINNSVAIFFTNGEVEARLDDFTIDIGAPGAVPPSVGFSSKQSETNYLEYSFTNSSTGATSFEWDFGDGNMSTEQSPTHVYAIHGIYTVTLKATNENNLSAELSRTIDIQAPVTADFTYQVDASDYRTYTFMDASVGAVMLLWEFGDGYQYTGMNPTHTYTEDGTYTVTLTAYSVTGNTAIATEQLVVAAGFVVQVLNGTFDEYTFNTGDNGDAWDMTPNSTVVDNNGNTVDSPYILLWNNTDLNAWNDAFYGDTNEQPATTSDGNNGTRGGKFSSPARRLYQVVQVEQGVSYTFSIDTRSEAMGINTEVFILNTEIMDEVGINASTSDAAVDAYFDITNDFNTDKTMFTTSTFTFTPSTNKIVIYVRSDAVDGATEVFLDNVVITEN